jgi:predicted RNase H-like HicB family nuclease
MRKPTKREFSVIVEKDAEGYYVASVPELRGCHTQARSLDQLLERVSEAIALCLAAGQAFAKGGSARIQR